MPFHSVQWGFCVDGGGLGGVKDPAAGWASLRVNSLEALKYHKSPAPTMMENKTKTTNAKPKNDFTRQLCPAASARQPKPSQMHLENTRTAHACHCRHRLPQSPASNTITKYSVLCCGRCHSVIQRESMTKFARDNVIICESCQRRRPGYLSTCPCLGPATSVGTLAERRPR